MSNLMNLADSVNFAWRSGKTPTFIYNGTTYEFSPDGLLAFVAAEGGASGDIVVDSVETGSLSVNSGVIQLLADGTITAQNLAVDLGEPGTQVVFANLPTADPEVSGQLWNDAGTLKISAGA